MTKRILAILITVVMVMSLSVTAMATGATAPYRDIAADRWSYNAIVYCKEHGLMSGVGDGYFNPTGEVTRAQATQALMQLAVKVSGDIDLPDGMQMPFKDVPVDSWYATAAKWARAYDILPVLGDTFSGATVLTRAELACMLWSAFGTAYSVAETPDLTLAIVGQSLDKYKDNAAVPAWGAERTFVVRSKWTYQRQ